MKIAVASGKGGTGKTTLAVALAQAWGESVCYLDCDVEEPNGHLFLRPTNIVEKAVSVLIPEVDKDRCIGCGACREICEFNAVVTIAKHALVFPELCHSCGGCTAVCPTGAMVEKPVRIGKVSVGESDGFQALEGLLDVGQMMAPPVIRAVKNAAPPDCLSILDCPPGTACPMITAVRGSDFVILVTEPTPFGLNDLKLAVETLRGMEIPFGVVINRSDMGDDRVVNYCNAENIALLLQIQESRKIAEATSRGDGMLTAEPAMKPELQKLIQTIRKEVRS